MSAIEGITAAMRQAFCSSIDITRVPAGYAVNTAFPLPDGDHLSFYVIDDENGLFHLEDDGTTLPNAIGAGLDLKSPVREGLLRGMLADEGVRLDDDLAIRSYPVREAEMGAASLRFISALIRTRDLTLLSRENVASTFADDVKAGLIERLPPGITIDEDGRVSDAGAPDIILRRATGVKAARIFAANGDLRLMDALVEYQASGAGDSPVVAVVDRRRGRVSERRFNTATNKGLPMAVVDGAGNDWVGRVLQLAS